MLFSVVFLEDVLKY